jgi:hypothetical protein
MVRLLVMDTLIFLIRNKNMIIEIKELFCMEWEMGKEIVLDENHAYSVNVYVGPVDSNMSESFTVTICNRLYK